MRAVIREWGVPRSTFISATAARFCCASCSSVFSDSISCGRLVDTACLKTKPNISLALVISCLLSVLFLRRWLLFFFARHSTGHSQHPGWVGCRLLHLILRTFLGQYRVFPSLLWKIIRFVCIIVMWHTYQPIRLQLTRPPCDLTLTLSWLSGLSAVCGRFSAGWRLLSLGDAVSLSGLFTGGMTAFSMDGKTVDFCGGPSRPPSSYQQYQHLILPP